MRLGIGSYTFTWAIGVSGQSPKAPLTPVQLLQQAVDLGVHVVQFCDNLPLTPLANDELQEFIATASRNKISVELGTRGLHPENLLKYLELAKRFNAPFVRIIIDSKGHEPSPEETVSLLKPLVRSFFAAGVKLAIENHDRFSAATLAGVVKALGKETVGVCLDTVNSFGALEGPEVVVKTLAPYALNLHVKDFTIQRVSSQMGFVVTGTPAGQGRLNVPWLLEQLRSAGREVNAILELWTPFGRSLEETLAREATWAKESIAYLRKFIPD